MVLQADFSYGLEREIWYRLNVVWNAVGVGVFDELLIDTEVVGDTHPLPFAEDEGVDVALLEGCLGWLVVNNTTWSQSWRCDTDDGIVFAGDENSSEIDGVNDTAAYFQC